MKIKTANFLVSCSDWRKCPRPYKPEYAFVGRSNVGKSSLINMLTNKKGLAKTSQTPGKTQLINHFEINGDWFLVDLPGYGYAKVSKTQRETWDKFIKDYIANRPNLMCLFVLVDSRLEPQKIDLDFINWLGENGVPLGIIFTKADKQKPQHTLANVEVFKNKLLESWDEMPQYFISSAEKKEGAEEILDFIGESNKAFDPRMIVEADDEDSDVIG
jgi:GTP-binding protein